MSFGATLDIAVNFSSFKIRDFHKVGALHYRAAIYYIQKSDPKQAKKFAAPLEFCFEKLTFSDELKRRNLICVPTLKEPYITEDRICFVSRQFPVNFVNRKFAENTTCYWKVNVDVERMDDLEFFIEVELVFKHAQKNLNQGERSFSPKKYFSPGEPQTVSVYRGKINKTYDVFGYLPVSFDEFESLQLTSTYHAIISEFKFSNDEDKERNQKQKQTHFFFLCVSRSQQQRNGSFKEYLQNLTENFLSGKVKTFYGFYRNLLVNTFESLSKRRRSYQNGTKSDKSNRSHFSTQRSQKQQEFSAMRVPCERFNHQFDKMYRIHQNLEQFERSKYQISDIILQEFCVLGQKINQAWVGFNTFVRANSYAITEQQQTAYTPILQQRYRNNIFSHRVKFQNERDFTYSRYDDSGRWQIEQAKKQNEKRLSESELWSGHFLVEDVGLIEREQKNIKMFEERYEVEYQKWNREFVGESRGDMESLSNGMERKQATQQKHIIFLVHGFGASKVNMLLLKTGIEMKYSATVIVSVENVGRTEESIEGSGERLAGEVRRHLSEVKESFKVSFIGHSMGGLIIRSAVPRLEQYRGRFHTYVSICTPHLGYLYEPTSFIKIGLWMLARVQKCESLKQVEMRDHSNLRRCYLYRLAMNGSLKWFRNVAFVASSQDAYVPYESARVEKSGRLLGEFRERQQQERAEIIEQMVDGMLNGLRRAGQISRMNVIFNIQEKTLEALIGRVGHVKFLSDEQFIKEFVICFGRFFE